jgi:hypothetical protein
MPKKIFHMPSRCLPVVVAAILVAACGETMNDQQAVASADVGGALQRLSGARVFFAHQSVGRDILSGIAQLEHSAGGPRLAVVERAVADQSSGGGFFAHANLGQNGDPKGKTDAFAAALASGLGGQLDLAMQKYCYVDIDARTDVDALFAYYRDAMRRIQLSYPKLKLVHFTAPLVRVQAGPRAAVKKLLGRTPDFYEDNAARERFNALMRREYESNVFDLAAFEASQPGGRPEPILFNGDEFFQLRPQYTTDGAHLNPLGQQRVAAEFVRYLSQAWARP